MSGANGSFQNSVYMFWNFHSSPGIGAYLGKI